jgi:hypothetical protein
MAFVKGSSGNSLGKIPGTLSKKTLVLKSFTETIVDGGMERFEEELSKLKGKQYVDAFLALLEYVQPRLQRSEVIGDGNLIVIDVKLPTDEKNSGQLAGVE